MEGFGISLFPLLVPMLWIIRGVEVDQVRSTLCSRVRGNTRLEILTLNVQQRCQLIGSVEEALRVEGRHWPADALPGLKHPTPAMSEPRLPRISRD